VPLYDYSCPGCGPFEVRADVSAAGYGAGCPQCGRVAGRVFSTPGGRAPRRRRQLSGLGGPALQHVDRAQSGAAAIGGLPPGTRLDE